MECEFDKKYKKFGWYDSIVIKCENKDCQKVDTLYKGSAINNMKRNKGLLIYIDGELKWFIPRASCKSGITIVDKNPEYIAGFFMKKKRK